MDARAIMTLALRLMGFWVLLQAVAATANFAGLLYWSTSPGAGFPGGTSVLIDSGFSLLAYASIAAVLLLFAPAIASLFPTESPDSTFVAADRPVTVRDVYIIAARLLGLYSLVTAAPAVQRFVRSILDYRFDSGPAAEFTWSSLVEVSVYLAGGAFLILSAVPIADLFSRAHGVSERSTTG